MKIRFQGSTLRLRLRNSEVARLMDCGEVREEVRFGDKSLVYSLVLDGEVNVPEASMDGQEIRVRVPRMLGLAWGNGPEIGISSTTVVPTVLIEKDFVRSAVVEPDDFDRFANPRSGRKPPPAGVGLNA